MRPDSVAGATVTGSQAMRYRQLSTTDLARRRLRHADSAGTTSLRPSDDELQRPGHRLDVPGLDRGPEPSSAGSASVRRAGSSQNRSRWKAYVGRSTTRPGTTRAQSTSAPWTQASPSAANKVATSSRPRRRAGAAFSTCALSAASGPSSTRCVTPSSTQPLDTVGEPHGVADLPHPVRRNRDVTGHRDPRLAVGQRLRHGRELREHRLHQLGMERVRDRQPLVPPVFPGQFERRRSRPRGRTPPTTSGC